MLFLYNHKVVLLLLVFVITITTNTIMIDAFVPNQIMPSISKIQVPKSSSSSNDVVVLRMVPKYIGNKWIPQSPDDMPEAGYGIIGTLIRQGPEPTITRIISPDDYEQAVLKFMVSEQCDRITAQANMDAYLRNPADWAYVRMEDAKRGRVRDYVTLKPLEIGKVLVWSTIVMALLGRAIYAISTGSRFNL